ncbi:hypothetical protein [Mycolicibacterium neworleansense]|uniref:hypothetical protein n=1 Tax=Mycolicibacterium neworleansense TaxID=146018 RepID=UPI00103F52AD|nr:hypothetical protein [Mycolicibacterium neworleansense]MCV7361480.1 hypothetical protein [Mycolicibacterium neworleansense]
MTMFCDDDVLAGMRYASAASLSYAGTEGAKGIAWQSVERNALWHRSCFRSIRLQNSVRPGRKRGPQEQSHKSLNLVVVADRNVA